MDWKKHRLVVGLVVLIGLIVAVFLLTESSQEQVVEDITEDKPELELPEIDAEKVDSLEIRRPESEPIEVSREGDGWKVTAPLEAEADENAVDTALDKLSDMEVSGVAATRAANHERLEVDDESGIHVLVTQGGEQIAHLIIGAYKSGNTMVRLDGEEQVLSVRGSIKYAFNKDLKNWRNREILEVAADEVQQVAFESEHGSFHFVRGEDDEWSPAAGQDEIERFDGSKVKSLVSRIAGMRAADFAAQDVTAEKAGLAPENAAKVTLYVATSDEQGKKEGAADGGKAEEKAGSDAGAEPAHTEQLVVYVGDEVEGQGQFYLRREGSGVVYAISKPLAESLRPKVDKFQKPEEGEDTEEGPSGGAGMKMPTKMGGAAGAQQLPPGVRKQIMQKIKQQRGH